MLPKIKKLLLTLLVLLCLAALGGGAFLVFGDRNPPEASLTPASGPVSATGEIVLALSDPSGVESVSVVLVQGQTRKTILEETFPAGAAGRSIRFSLADQGAKEGPLTVEVTAVDGSAARFGQGNLGTTVAGFVLDTRPPLPSPRSTAHNVNHGGVGVIAYAVNEEVAASGVQVGTYYFPGYRQPSGLYLALFAFPESIPFADLKPRLTATDVAGNTRSVGFIFLPLVRAFKSDTLDLPLSFLETKMPEFEPLVPEATDHLDRFLKVNSVLRDANNALIASFANQTSAVPLFAGAFLRMPNTAPRAAFGDRRTYLFEGKEIDRQVHLGVDLASLQTDQVPAANNGRVVHTGDIGIYGNTVIIDHGLGLMTLYAHLSEISVQAGENVARGQVVGRTGMTGLAGGDHLHFGVYVSGVPVNPIEWWDPHWIQDNVDLKFDLVREEQPAEPAAGPAAGI
jgi:hypothetical protein